MNPLTLFHKSFSCHDSRSVLGSAHEKNDCNAPPTTLPSLVPYGSALNFVFVQDNARKPCRAVSDDVNLLSHMKMPRRRKDGSLKQRQPKQHQQPKGSRWWNSMSSLENKGTDRNKTDQHSHCNHLDFSTNDDMVLEPTQVMGLSSSSSLQLSSTSLHDDHAFRSSLEAKKPKRLSSDEVIPMEDQEMQTDNDKAQTTTPTTPCPNDNSSVFRSSLEAKKPKRQPSWNDNRNGSNLSFSSSSSSNTSVEKSFLEISQELSQEFPPPLSQELTGRNLDVRKAFCINASGNGGGGGLPKTMGVASMLDAIMSENDDDDDDEDAGED